MLRGLVILLMVQMSSILKVIRMAIHLCFNLCALACLRVSVSVYMFVCMHMCMSPCQTFLPSCARKLPISAFQFLICCAREREWKRERGADGGVKERRKIDEPIGIKFGGRNDCQAQYPQQHIFTALTQRQAHGDSLGFVLGS